MRILIAMAILFLFNFQVNASVTAESEVYDLDRGDYIELKIYNDDENPVIVDINQKIIFEKDHFSMDTMRMPSNDLNKVIILKNLKLKAKERKTIIIGRGLFKKMSDRGLYFSSKKEIVLYHDTIMSEVLAACSKIWAFDSKRRDYFELPFPENDWSGVRSATIIGKKIYLLVNDGNIHEYSLIKRSTYKKYINPVLGDWVNAKAIFRNGSDLMAVVDFVWLVDRKTGAYSKVEWAGPGWGGTLYATDAIDGISHIVTKSGIIWRLDFNKKEYKEISRGWENVKTLMNYGKDKLIAITDSIWEINHDGSYKIVSADGDSWRSTLVATAVGSNIHIVTISGQYYLFYPETGKYENLASGWGGTRCLLDTSCDLSKIVEL